LRNFIGLGGISPARRRVSPVKIIRRATVVVGRHVVEGIIIGHEVVNGRHCGLIVIHMHLRNRVLAGWLVGIIVVRFHVSSLTVPLV